jgi:hypothetical protein
MTKRSRTDCSLHGSRAAAQKGHPDGHQLHDPRPTTAVPDFSTTNDFLRGVVIGVTLMQWLFASAYTQK